MEWASQDEEVQRDRMGHYKQLQNAARGFLSMAVRHVLAFSSVLFVSLSLVSSHSRSSFWTG